MAIISIRLNEDDEKILKYLKNYYKRNKSSLIKQMLQEKYEDLQDMKVILDFENDKTINKTSFVSFDEIIGS